MDTIASIEVKTAMGRKVISVLCGDIAELTEPLDVMTVSAFQRNYAPVFRTMIGGLYAKGISVQDLSYKPEIDLRDVCNTWLSAQIPAAEIPIKRIGCVELLPLDRFAVAQNVEERVISSVGSYFRMLDIASLNGISVKTIGLPVLGSGSQNLSGRLVAKPIINECLRFLQQNEHVEKIIILDRSLEKANVFAEVLQQSYSVLRNTLVSDRNSDASAHLPLAFISYSSTDKNVADNLCTKLEASGIRVWYAPRDIDDSAFATAIVKAISRSTHFVVILSNHSLQSEHVLNEIDLAFQEIRRGIRFYPLKLDDKELGPSFRYYLSRQHWMDARIPPLEKRLDEFVQKVTSELSDDPSKQHGHSFASEY